MFERVYSLLLTFVTGFLIARTLKPEFFGQLNYLLSLVTILQPFASLGLMAILVRDIVLRPDDQATILGTTITLKLAAGLVSMIVSAAMLFVFQGWNDTQMVMILVLGIGQALKAFNSVEYWFQARSDVFPFVFYRSMVTTLFAALRIWGIYSKMGLIFFALTYGFEFAVCESVLLIPYLAKGGKILLWRFSWKLARSYLSASFPLIISGFAAVIYLKIDQIMLAQMVSKESVGIYAAASRISEAWYVIPVAISAAIFPGLVRAREQNQAIYNKKLQVLFTIFFLFALAIAIGTNIFADRIILLAFGKSYAASAPVLVIHIWAGVFVSMRAVFSKWILAENELSLSVVSQVGGAIVNVILNIFLIPTMHELGSAIATVISYAAASYFMLFFSSKSRPIAFMMTRAILSPVLLLSGALGISKGRIYVSNENRS